MQVCEIVIDIETIILKTHTSAKTVSFCYLRLLYAINNIILFCMSVVYLKITY